MHLLVVDDDDHLREVVRFTLEQAGYACAEARNGVEMLEQVEQQAPDLIVLDVLMPLMDGMTALRELRRAHDTPVVLLSTRGEEMDRVMGLDQGADDYLPKPFSPRELVSRVRAVLRRTRPAPAARGLQLDPQAHRASFDGRPLDLTSTEFRLLAALHGQPGRVFSRQQLAARAYEDGRFVSERTIDSHVRNLRAKLAAVGMDAPHTVRGVGYRLTP